MLLILLLGVFVALGPSEGVEHKAIDHWRHGAKWGDRDTMIPPNAPKGNDNQYVIKHDICQGYQPTVVYKVKIEGPLFKGFFCRSQKNGNMAVKAAAGRFPLEFLPDHTRQESAYPAKGATHLEFLNRTSLTLKWRAPTEDVGTLQFFCTFVGADNLFYGPMKSSDIHYSSAANKGECGDPEVSWPVASSSCLCQDGPRGPEGEQGPEGNRGPSLSPSIEGKIAHMTNMMMDWEKILAYKQTILGSGAIDKDAHSPLNAPRS